MKYQKYFPEKKQEAEYDRIVYLVKYLKTFELYKFHYFRNSDQTCLVKVLSKGTIGQAEKYAKVYGYILKQGSELPEFWEAVS